MSETFGQCLCGAAWFEIAVPPDSEGFECGAAVCIDTDGHITGYAGVLTCIECGSPWNSLVRFRGGKGHLRVVEGATGSE
jgi:hypothetical protein